MRRRRALVLALLVALVAATAAVLVRQASEVPPVTAAEDESSPERGVPSDATGQDQDSQASTGLADLAGAGDAAVEVALPIEDAAAGVIEGYEDRGSCVLVRSGYLDLSGRVWGMVVEGAGWVEVCVVQKASDGGSSRVTVMHMDVDEWALSLGDG